MATDTPIHEWETTTTTDALVGATWKVISPHHGHTMLVVARVTDQHGPTSMLLVRCSCGESFRMAQQSVERHT